MEWCIPIQTFQVEHVQLGTLLRNGKPLVPLAYKDADFHFPTLSFLLPTLPVKSYDLSTGRLVLSLAESAQTLSKLQILQDMLFTAVSSHYSVWYPGTHRSIQELRNGFQPMIQNSELHLYCPAYDSVAQPIPFYNEGVWSHGRPKSGGLRTGKRVRIAIRLYGISFHISPGTHTWSGKFRLQHKVIAVMIA
jgi:hypothetical protein